MGCGFGLAATSRELSGKIILLCDEIEKISFIVNDLAKMAPVPLSNATVGVYCVLRAR